MPGLVGKPKRRGSSRCCKEQLIEIIPVIDLKGGIVVRGVGGRREEYRPIMSSVVASADPIDVATALHARFEFSHFYVADLDAIAGGEPCLDLYSAWHRHGYRLMVDAGVRDARQVASLLDHGVPEVIVGMETVAGPERLAEILQHFPAEAIIFSLDLKGGCPLGDPIAWGNRSAEGVLDLVLELGTRRILLLDLAKVGMGTGVGTECLAQRAKEAAPAAEVIVGGGIRGPDDLQRLRGMGVDAVLVASALHDGRLSRDEIRKVAGERH